jgi:hypothetical protein
MSRLTPFSRLLIVLLILGSIFFAAKKFLPSLQGKMGNNASNTEMPNNGNSGSGSTSNTSNNNNSGGNSGSATNSGTSTAPSGATFTPSSFAYTPTAPAANGKLKGVVELGATGFNSFIIRIDNQKNWKLEKAEFGASLVYEKLATDEDVRAGLKTYIANMLAFGVNPADIHFVISSGAKKVEITSKIIETLKTMKYFVNEVTAEQEGKLALRCVLPKGFENKAFVTDIGSGNTKISWINGGQVSALEASGAKYFQNNQTDDAVFQEVSAKAGQVPSNLRETCFIIGGVPFELAKQIRNGKERYTVLKAPGNYKADGAKQTAGLNIYNAIAQSTGCKQFIFDWDSNFTIGFLLNL